ncbi:MAG: hypothetical protein FD181_2773 [Prolixibacteraceae bacterium]|nr:MAG: hypothetical protein FD181_2773 [Prolixibacteraceae bacterium]
MENKRQPIELADIFRDCGDDFPKTHNLCADQAKAFYAIENCRTAALGGHTNRCDQCGFTKQFAGPEGIIQYLGNYNCTFKSKIGTFRFSIIAVVSLVYSIVGFSGTVVFAFSDS